jgi:hypothetical protein
MNQTLKHGLTDGVDLSQPNALHATVLNAHKSEYSGKPEYPPNILCSSRDFEQKKQHLVVFSD